MPPTVPNEKNNALSATCVSGLLDAGDKDEMTWLLASGGF